MRSLFSIGKSDGSSVNSLRLVTKQPTPQMENESTAVKVHHTIGHQDGVGAIREGFLEEVACVQVEILGMECSAFT